MDVVTDALVELGSASAVPAKDVGTDAGSKDAFAGAGASSASAGGGSSLE